MIKGVHTMFYSAEADALRAFLRDKIGFPATDVGEGWLIFQLPEADMGVHPTGYPGSPPSGTAEISFYCDDVEATRAELEARGVTFKDTITDQGYGLVTHLEAPGGLTIQLYQPKYGR
ncbi:MAG: VOC family protein [Deltaproteobacteria bacterium]|nr:VOC family protein [Deltaproteobacteria bacterium]